MPINLLNVSIGVSIPYRFNERQMKWLLYRYPCQFQFLIGSMKDLIAHFAMNESSFQFLIGSMKVSWIDCSNGSARVSIPYRFNESCQVVDYSFLLRVSIPYRFNERNMCPF